MEEAPPTNQGESEKTKDLKDEIKKIFQFNKQLERQSVVIPLLPLKKLETPTASPATICKEPIPIKQNKEEAVSNEEDTATTQQSADKPVEKEEEDPQVPLPPLEVPKNPESINNARIQELYDEI